MSLLNRMTAVKTDLTSVQSLETERRFLHQPCVRPSAPANFPRIFLLPHSLVGQLVAPTSSLETFNVVASAVYSGDGSREAGHESMMAASCRTRRPVHEKVPPAGLQETLLT